MILNELYFFNNQDTAGTSEIMSNVKGDLLILQVKCSDTFQLSVQGNLGIDENTYAGLSAISMGSFDKVATISAQGIYQIDISGCRKVKLVLSSIGSAPLTAYGMVKEG